MSCRGNGYYTTYEHFYMLFPDLRYESVLYYTGRSFILSYYQALHNADSLVRNLTPGLSIILLSRG